MEGQGHTIQSEGYIDGCLIEVESLRSLILRYLARQKSLGLLEPLQFMLVILLVTLAHMVFFWVVGKTYPGEISYLSVVLAPFIIWNVFKCTMSRSKLVFSSQQYDKAANIGWIHIFLSVLVYDLLRVIAVFGLTVLASSLFWNNTFVMPFRWPSLPSFFLAFGLAAMLGAGFGLLLTSLEHRWSVFKLADHIVLWILFVTSGIYDSYVDLPDLVAPVFAYNPILTLVEQARQALNPTYPMGDLTLLYPFWTAVVCLGLGIVAQKVFRLEDA